MDKKTLVRFWNCGDDDIIQFAIIKAHLNKREKQVIEMMLDECMTQEEIAEELNFSTRRIQQIWCSGAGKLLSISWLRAIAEVCHD